MNILIKNFFSPPSKKTPNVLSPQRNEDSKQNERPPARKFPSFLQWKKFFSVLSKKERILFFSFLLLFFGSGFSLGINFYFQNTEIVPAPGGIYREGIVGQPRLINPLYATSDAERDLVEILFAGLMKYSPEGKIVPDLAERYETDEEKKVYNFYLRENLFWSDGKPITADDIIFTVKTLQDPIYKSPYLASWLDVSIEKISERQIKFHLKKPYFSFLELTTFKIIPEHIWQDIPPQNFPLAIYNLKPVSSGPYKIEKIVQDDLGYIKSLILIRNPYYFGKKPFLSKITLLFFSKEQELLGKALNQEVDGFSTQVFPPSSFLNFKLSQILLPRYFALFFNPEKSKILADKTVREVLNYATDKEEILEKALDKKGEIVNSPLLPEIYGFNHPSQVYINDKEKAKELLITAGFKKINSEGIREKLVKREIEFEFKNNLTFGSQGKEVEELQKCLAKDAEVYPEGEITSYFGNLTKEAVIRFQEKYASEILEPQGLEKGTGDVKAGSREKLNELCARVTEETLPLKLTLVTVDQPQLKKVATALKEQWLELGIDLEIKTFVFNLEFEQNYLRPRNYEILLFGQFLGMLPDFFPFWHSKQKEDPGLNLAAYENKKADELIIAARQSQDFQTFKENCEKLQNTLLEDLPAIFLYNPYYLYLFSPAIKGFETKLIADPSKRFTNIENWYIKKKRVLK